MCLAQGPQRSDAGEARTRRLGLESSTLQFEPLRSLEHLDVLNVHLPCLKRVVAQW